MRTIEYGTPTHVPAFLTKLWKLVTDVACDELISWSPTGTSFIIFDEIRFSKELLPMYFKHNNMASFVRQLNMYGFRKLSCIDQGGMHCYRSEIEFYHQYFLKGQESLLELIKRKIPNSKSEEPKVKQEYIDELMNSIKSLKGKQENAEQGMKRLKSENRLLWQNFGALAEKYNSQQMILQKILPFFMNMVHHSCREMNHREVGFKRKPPLMIDEGSGPSKMPRLTPPYYVEHNDQDHIGSMPPSPGNVSNRGPVIHDVTELESSKMFPANILCSTNTSSKDNEAIVDSPLSCSLESSEQTTDSPYTDSSPLESLNILNHNFERSSSLSPHIEMKHSPVSTTSPLHQHSPQVRAMPSPQPSASGYSASNGISPITIIDETTSDVPLSGSMMTSSFVPKIENTCTDSNMYSMDSMLSERASMMSDRMSPASDVPLSGNIMASSFVPKIEDTDSGMYSMDRMLNERASIMQERARLVPDRASMMQERSTAMPEGTSMMQERSPIMTEGTSLMPERSSIMPERSPIMPERTPMMPNRTTLVKPNSSMLTEKSSSAVRETPSTSGQSKFLPSNFELSAKNIASSMPWLLNQETDGNDGNLDSWLGQIFKSDNLVPGLSLPHQQAD